MDPTYKGFGFLCGNEAKERIKRREPTVHLQEDFSAKAMDLALHFPSLIKQGFTRANHLPVRGNRFFLLLLSEHVSIGL